MERTQCIIPANIGYGSEELAGKLVQIYQENNALQRLPEKNSLTHILQGAFQDMEEEIDCISHRRPLSAQFIELNQSLRLLGHPYERVEDSVSNYLRKKEMAENPHEKCMSSRVDGYGLLGMYLIAPLVRTGLSDLLHLTSARRIGYSLLYLASLPVVIPLGLVAATGHMLLPQSAREKVILFVEKLIKKPKYEFYFDKEGLFNAIDQELNTLLDRKSTL